MARITTIINQKGGTGKSTTAHALAAGLAHRGCKVLVLDADAQGNISYTMRADPSQAGLYSVMRGVVDAAAATQHHGYIDIIASSLDLAGADMEFTQTGREYVLREALEQIREQYSHIIIDSPPALGIMSVNALTASTDVVIPVCADIYSLQGLRQLLSTIGRVRKYSNKDIAIAGLLVTRKGQATNAGRAMQEQIQATAAAEGLHLYSATIREAVAVREAQIMRQSIFDISPSAKVTADYNTFIDEYLSQESGRA